MKEAENPARHRDPGVKGMEPAFAIAPMIKE